MTSRGQWTVVLLAAGVAVGLMTPVRRLADASTYIMMADSLWYDRDLVYEPRDLQRARALQVEDLPAGLFLVKHPGTYTYGKPFVYPLAAAPWYAMFGPRGFLALNGLLLAGIVFLGADIVSWRVGWRAGVVVASVVLGASVVPAYLHWIDPYLFCTALVAGALAAYRRQRPVWCAVLLVTAAACRAPYLVLAGAPALLYVLARRWRDALRFALAAALAGALLLGVGGLATGQWSAYTGERYYYPHSERVPYESGGATPEVGQPSGRETLLAWRWPGAAAWGQSNIYFFLGRAAGVLVYFPTLLACALWARRWDREKVVWLGALVGCCEVIQLVLPHNMIGGTATLGNRYFVLLPIALVLVDFVAWRPLRALATAALLLCAVPVAQAPVHFSLHPGRQMLEFPYRLLPLEWTQAARIPYPVHFPRMAALTMNQYDWEQDGVWTIGGRKAEFVLFRRSDRPPRVRLWSKLPRARITDGQVSAEVRFDDAPEQEFALSHPMAVFRDESEALIELAVYYLAVETDAGVWAHAIGSADDHRYLGVFVKLVP